ncbi:MAG: hypothetical protein AAFR66_18180 [Bacteroidota bacterium]
MKYLASIIMIFGFFSTEILADDIVKIKNIFFQRIEVPDYKVEQFTPHVKLEMNYARSEVAEEGEYAWIKRSPYVKALEIDLVFTMYPVDTTKWRTDYSSLLNDRMEALFKLDPKLKDDPTIRWNMYLQTSCESEDQAKEYFHGFVVKYRPRKVRTLDRIKSSKDMRSVLNGYARIKDSTVFKVMERNRHWNDMLVVMDWTGSMYKYGLQMLLWHKQQLKDNNSSIKHLVLFNDGNNRKNWQKKPGKTGGIYKTPSHDLEYIIKTMAFVMKKGDGGDAEENDLEAVLTGINHLNKYEDIILIADNKSEVRDMELLVKINRPVHIILCDTEQEKIHPHYKEIAEKTGGSIHTIGEDFSMKAVGSSVDEAPVFRSNK